MQEVFAPVVILEPFDSFDEVIAWANCADYSLHAGIFTADLEVALEAADSLEASGVMINDSSDFRFDAMPFGGYKRGSLGREGVRYAMQEMTQSKVVCFNRS
jgi:acyl-CoA reductase-like NAD-dependent aldehyde dehydrogenase